MRAPLRALGVLALLLLAPTTVVAWDGPAPPLPVPALEEGERIVDTDEAWLVWGGPGPPPVWPLDEPVRNPRDLADASPDDPPTIDRTLPFGADATLHGHWWSGARAPFIGITHGTWTAEQEAERERAEPEVSRTRLVYPGPSREEALRSGDLLGPDEAPTHLYFTRTFHVDDPSRWVALQTEIQFATGMVAWLNGTEIARHHLDPGLERLRTLATHYWLDDHIMQMVYRRWQRNWRGIDAGLLRPGENTLSVVVVRRDIGQPRDHYFDLWLDAFERPGFLRTPYLQRVEEDRVTVMFVTNTPAVAWVEYGETGGALDRLATHAMETGTHHEIVLPDLHADARWTYRVVWRPVLADGTLGAAVTSAEASFRTAAPPGTPFVFLAYGDNRTNADIHTRLNERMWTDAWENDARFVVHTGDLITNASPWDEWQREFFRPALPLLGWFPFYTSLGNHEGNHTAYYENMALPGNEAWYAFQYGDVEFFALNSGIPITAGDPQLEWLDGALSTSGSRWKIVFFHHPPHACTPSRKPGDEAIRTHVVPLLERHGVQLVLAGHDHLYGRSAELGGVTYVITGGGGAPTYPAEPDATMPWCVRVHHYTRVQVDADRLRLEAISIDGERIDAFELLHPTLRGER